MFAEPVARSGTWPFLVRVAGSPGIVVEVPLSYLDLAKQWLDANAEVIDQAGNHWLEHGQWLTVMDLARSALRRDPSTSRDPFADMRALPPPLGRVEHPDERVILRVRALASLPEAQPVLRGFLAAVELAAKRLVEEGGEEPKLRKEDLIETLSLSSPLLDRVSAILLIEDWFLGGGSGNAEGDWQRDIGDRTVAVLKVRSLADYLHVEGDRFWNRPATQDLHPANPLIETEQVPLGQTAPAAAVPSLSVDELYGPIAQAAGELMAVGHFDSAVRAAALAFRDLLRERSGRHDLDGVDLAGAALGGKNPPIGVADLSAPEGRNEQDGWRMLAQGCFAAIRNPVAHRGVYRERASAMEALATMSFVASWVAANEPWPGPPGRGYVSGGGSPGVGMGRARRHGAGPERPDLQ